ncbi:MAG: hypothetical protein Q9166_008021, partial [cf. Caloplaca sp. 2 TL-2023]
SASAEGAALCGFQLGNRAQAGYLTKDDSVRLHSCEHGTKCGTLETSKNIIWITPLISRSDKGDVPELGAGGGGGDLAQAHELELTDPEAGLKLIELCKGRIRDDKMLTQILRLVEDALCSDRKSVALNLFDASLKEDVIPLEDLAHLLMKAAARNDYLQHQADSLAQPLHQLSAERVQSTVEAEAENARHMRFPYSRHSSYTEMCHLLSVFRPLDVYPCVTDEESWSPTISIESLFGHLCTGTSFLHDQEMRLIHDLSIAPLPPSSPQSGTHERAETAESISSSRAPGGSPELDWGPSVSDQPNATRGDASDVILSSAGPNKRRGTAHTDPQKTSQRRVEWTSRERFEQQEDGALTQSFSGWLDPPVKGSLPTKRAESDSAGTPNVDSIQEEICGPSRRTTVSDPDRKGLSSTPPDRVPKSRKDLKLLGVDCHSPTQRDNVSSLPNCVGRNSSSRAKPRNDSIGTRRNPVELSDTSASETEVDAAEDDGRTQAESLVDQPSGHRS